MPTPIELLLDPASLAFFALYAALLLWERLLPARALPEQRGAFARGAVSLVAYFFVSSYLPLAAGDALAHLRVADASGLGTLGGAAVAFAIYEVLAYGWHRALHGSPWLWRAFHQLHHSPSRLDVPTAFWFGPLDLVGWTLVSSLALSLVGLTPGATTAFVMGTTFLAIFQHANVRTPFWLGYLVQRPENHSFHHERGRHTGNFADLSLLDIVFGTFENHEDFAQATGFGDESPARLRDMLLLRDVATS